jgi:ElaB/YqjD/DUF883 family membrane-anchored ribosome-binding protein
MTDLSREELRAHLSAVEAQVRAALRIVAAESKSVQQAHSALRADLSAALVRLQSDISTGNSRLDAKVEKVISEVDALGRQRRFTTLIVGTLVLLCGIAIGLLAGGSYFLIKNLDERQSFGMGSLFQQTTPETTGRLPQGQQQNPGQGAPRPTAPAPESGVLVPNSQ